MRLGYSVHKFASDRLRLDGNPNGWGPRPANASCARILLISPIIATNQQLAGRGN